MSRASILMSRASILMSGAQNSMSRGSFSMSGDQMRRTNADWRLPMAEHYRWLEHHRSSITFQLTS